ncbi:response regulator [Fulvimarina endophytica]|uniref:Response regulator n=1 Tax=Fulvimarina endophytica TaxID=2293836 RepID=A0A371WY38_9HYPH|nr:response regulator [Fulvimarina endophytica]
MSHAAASISFHIVVLDIDLARGDDGITTAILLREEHGIEALFVSAHHKHEVRALSLDWKPIGFIGKPYLPQQVLAAIDKIGHA